MAHLDIQENRINDVVLLLQSLPEFVNPPSAADILGRIAGVPHLVLTAHVDGQVCGCKVGYERDGRFYSWLGGVLPAFRKAGIAAALADRQEAWAAQQGYRTIWMKTRNRFPAMLLMAVRRGFRITAILPEADILEHRIVLEKSI